MYCMYYLPFFPTTVEFVYVRDVVFMCDFYQMSTSEDDDDDDEEE